jgi:hypothetical protein
MKKWLLIIPWAVGLLVIVNPSLADVIYIQVDDKGTVCFTDNPVSPRARVHQESWQESTPAVMKTLPLGNRPGPRETGVSTTTTSQPQKAVSKEDSAGIIKRLSYGNRQFPKDQLLLYYKSMSRVELLQEEAGRRRRAPEEVTQASRSSSSRGSRRVVSG